MSSIGRALKALETLAQARGGLALSELATRLHIPKSTLHGVLTSLTEAGYVRQVETTERYTLTMRLPALGFGYLAATDTVNVCQPELDQLATKVRAVVQLRVVDGDELVRVAWAQGSRSPLRFTPLLQASDYVHSTASGNAWLASMSDTEAARIVLNQGFPFPDAPGNESSGPYAPRTLPALFERLRQAREQGYGLNIEDSSAGVHAIAVAINAGPPDNPRVVGTLSIAGPSVEIPKERILELLPQLRETAAALAEVWPIHSFISKRAQ